MFGSDDNHPVDWETWGLIFGLVWLGTKFSRAVATIAKTVEKANNFGLTDAEMTAASATLQSKTATLQERQAAIATLQTKVAGAEAAGYGKQVAAAKKALQLLDAELRKRATLDADRKAWEERNPDEARKLRALQGGKGA